MCPVGRPIGHQDSRASFVTGKGTGSKCPLQADIDSDAVAPDDQGGSLTRQAESDHAVSDASPHIANIWRMVEVSHVTVT